MTVRLHQIGIFGAATAGAPAPPICVAGSRSRDAKAALVGFKTMLPVISKIDLVPSFLHVWGVSTFLNPPTMPAIPESPGDGAQHLLASAFLAR